ncbi:MAG: hypothetical protein R3F37_15865 [Candidatus Competibacteraceae bacterium]
MFRIGIATRATIELAVGPEAGRVLFEFMQQQGHAGGKAEVIHKATLALDELMEGLQVYALTTEPVTLTARFDEFNLDVSRPLSGSGVAYQRTTPSPQAMLDDPDLARHLIGALILHYTDRVESSHKDGYTEIRLHFTH